MNSNVKEKMEKTSNIIAILLKISRILCFVIMGVLVAGIIYIALNGNVDLIRINNEVIVHSPFSSDLLKGYNSSELITICASVLLNLLFIVLLVRKAEAIFRDIAKEHTPFTALNVKRIRVIAIFYFIIACNGVEPGTGFHLTFSINILGIIGALIFWCLSVIFQYGCELQQESDETL